MNSNAFQAAAVAQGRDFEALVSRLLTFAGWEVTDEHATVAGAEIDLVAVDTGGVEWWIECKGSYMGKLNGAARGDTAKKAIAVAWYLSTLPGRRPYLLVASHLPRQGTLPHRMLGAALDAGLFDEIRTVSNFYEPWQPA